MLQNLKLLFFTAMFLSVAGVAAAQSPGAISTVAGNGYQGEAGLDGPATAAQFIAPNSVAVDTAGNFYISDVASEQIYKVSKGKVSVLAGTGAGGYSGDGGSAIRATFNHPFALAFGPSGNLYVTDSRNNVIRMINMSTSRISTVVGTGAGAGPGDADACMPLTSGVPARAATLCNPFGIAVDAGENLYFTNSTGQVAKVTAATGLVTVIAGTGNWGYAGDGGPALNASFSWLPGLALDGAGNIYVTDNSNCAVRMINAATGIITSLVGTPASAWSGTCGLSGDGGPASAAMMNGPFGIAADGSGDLFVADSSNNLVRVITPGGTIYTLAGENAGQHGVNGYSGDGGPATSATLFQPHGVAVDSAGNLYISDFNNFAVRMVAQASASVP